MSAIVVVIVATVLLALALAFGAVALWRGSWATRSVEVTAQGFGRYAVRTPLGRASVRTVVHDDLGRVFEVRTYFRGEPEMVEFIPPAHQLLVGHMQRRVDEAKMRRTARRRVARTR